MSLSSGEALRQAHLTAHDYAANTISDLCEMLNIDRQDPKWRTQLAPFAVVWAAMISAAAADYDTGMRCGVVEGYPTGNKNGRE